MTDNDNFFDSPQAAAIYKHALLKRYIGAWAGKVGSTSAGNRVVVYDAYSGPGRYGDDHPGSPALLVDTSVALRGLRNVHTVFSEKNPSHRAELQQMLDEFKIDRASYEIRAGNAEEEAPGVVQDAGTAPLFVFLDPFGLAVPFETVVYILNARHQPRLPRHAQAKTEVLLNFSYEAVRRLAGAFRSEKDYRAKPAQIATMDRAMGGDWWQHLARDQAEGWEAAIMEGYARLIKQRTGCGYITAKVSDALDAAPVYELILFTRHRDGLWAMNDAMSLARADWRKWIVENSVGQGLLFSVSFDDDEDAWVEEVAENIEQILSTVPAFRVEERLEAVLGRTLGLARVKHIRAAIKRLEANDVVPAGSSSGKLQKAHIARK